MGHYIHHQLRGNQFLLTASRCIYWEDEKALILSDLHLGKAGHFRKNGIGIPQTVFMEDLQRLVAEIRFFNPNYLIFIGDLFHSEANKEHLLFEKWRNDLSLTDMHLVRGNHDILSKEWYSKARIHLHEEKLLINDFSFIHDRDLTDNVTYCFSGHVHPGIIMHGKARQTMRLACFYFGKEHAILPAFGKFTGTYPVNPSKDDNVFVVTENRVIRFQ